MEEATYIKKLKAQEQAAKATPHEPTYVVVEPWLVVATRLALIVLAGGALHSVLRDIVISSGEMLRWLLEVMG